MHTLMEMVLVLFQRLEYFNIRAVGELSIPLDKTFPDCHNSKIMDPTVPSMYAQLYD